MNLREHGQKKFTIAEVLRAAAKSSLPDHELLRLLKRAAALFERSSEDMRRHAVKHDALRRYLASHEESTAAERAVLLVAGCRQVNIPTQGAVAPGFRPNKTARHSIST